MIRLPLAHKIAASVLPTVLVTVLGLGLWTYRTAYETARERIHVALGYVADRYLHDRVETIWARSWEAIDASQRARALSEAADIVPATGAGLQIVVLDEQDRVLYLTGTGFAGAHADWARMAREAAAGQGTLGSSDGEWLYARRDFAPWGWRILCLMPEASVTEMLGGIRRATLTVAAVAGFVVVLLLLWLSGEVLLKPIGQLRAAAARIARSPTRLRIGVPDGDELGELARAMEQMSSALAEQIDARSTAERSLERVKNLYAALSGANRAIVRVHERTELFRMLCRIAAEHGRFRLAWVGVPDEYGEMCPVASAGPASDILDGIRISIDEHLPEGQGTMGRAWRSGGWAVENDFLGASVLRPWHRAARQHAIYAVAAFALREEGRTIACLSVYAGERDFFRDDLIELLKDLATDVSFALDGIARAGERDRAEVARREAEERWHFALEGSGDGAWDYDIPAGRIFASRRCMELLGHGDGDGVSDGYLEWEHLLHPEDRVPARLAIDAHLRGETERFARDQRLLAADGRWRWFRTSGKVMRRDAEGRPLRMLGTLHDITAHKEAEARILWLGHRDALTGLPNRALLADRLEQALVHARRTGGRVAVMFLDLDRFKSINDSLGHEAGDLLLKEVAARLCACVRGEDTVSRRGGDEFVVVLAEAESLADVDQIAARILARLAEPFALDGRIVHTSTSLGIALCPEDGSEAEMLIRNADAAMYSAKERGRNNFQFYTAGLNEQAARRLAIEAGLRAALAEGTLELFYQPQAELASGRVLRAEALLRDSRGRLADVSPAEFVPVAEECGLIDRIGEWVLRAACQQARAWADAGLPLLPVAVNLSAAQFRRRDLAAIIADALAGESLPGEWLEIELTESLVMRDAEAAAEIFRQLKAMGVRLAIDDFGTGYSSLSYLKRFPIDRLKIDRSFVRDLPADRSSAELTRAIVAMAHALHLEVVAEGVERAEQQDFLAAIGCDQYQGYWLAAPRSAADFAVWLAGQEVCGDAALPARRAAG